MAFDEFCVFLPFHLSSFLSFCPSFSFYRFPSTQHPAYPSTHLPTYLGGLFSTRCKLHAQWFIRSWLYAKRSNLRSDWVIRLQTIRAERYVCTILNREKIYRCLILFYFIYLFIYLFIIICLFLLSFAAFWYEQSAHRRISEEGKVRMRRCSAWVRLFSDMGKYMSNQFGRALISICSCLCLYACTRLCLLAWGSYELYLRYFGETS